MSIHFFVFYKILPAACLCVGEEAAVIKKPLIKAMPAGAGIKQHFCYSGNYNIKAVVSCIIKKGRDKTEQAGQVNPV